MWTYLKLGLTYLIWLPCALLSDLVGLLCVPFDVNRFVQTYINIRINKHNIDNAIAQIGIPAPKESAKWYKETGMGYTGSTDNEG